jgi:hypothetical protein
MKPRYSLLIAGLCAFCSGCELIQLAACNLSYEGWLCKEHTVACVRNRELAEEAWREALCSSGGQAYSVDYARGFKAGYAAYLDSSGCLTPPALPPKHYWTGRYQSPQGHRAIEEWFLGHEHGAQAARASGRREFITVPVLGPRAAPTAQFPVEPLPESARHSDQLSLPPAASVFPIAGPSTSKLPAASGSPQQ